MAEVDGITLAKAIRAVDDKMHRIEAQLKELDPDDDEYYVLDMDYLGYMKASHALRDAYEEEIKSATNLLPYNKLVRESL